MYPNIKFTSNQCLKSIRTDSKTPIKILISMQNIGIESSKKNEKTLPSN